MRNRSNFQWEEEGDPGRVTAHIIKTTRHAHVVERGEWCVTLEGSPTKGGGGMKGRGLKKIHRRTTRLVQREGKKLFERQGVEVHRSLGVIGGLLSMRKETLECKRTRN